jgi:MscS family membrane protein
MPLRRQNRRKKSESLNWARALELALIAFLFVGSTAHLPAQLATSAASAGKTQPAAPVDPLGRETPRGAFIGLLKYAEREDFATAARYLQSTPGQDTDFVQLAKELRALHSKFKGHIDLLSDEPSGTVEAGLPPGEVRAGVLTVGGTSTDLILVRVDDPAAGKIWLVSKDTVAKIPGLYAQMESEGPTPVEQMVPAALTNRHLVGMSLAQWLGWLLSIPISWFLAWSLEFLLSAPRRIWCKLRKLPFSTVWKTPLGMPLRCIVAILLHGVFVYQLDLPLLYRAYYARFLAALLVGCFAWLVSRITDRGFEHAVNRTRTQRAGGESILIVLQRLTRILMLLIGFVCALAALGVNVRTTLAGLGIGGLALALGAQKSLENILGGVTLLMDKALHVGNFCKIGNQVGTVEDIGLRSVKLRTLDQSLLVVPNGLLAQMQFENFGPRRKCLLNQHLFLRIETQVEQLRFVLARVQSMLDQHPEIETGTSRIRVADFAGSAFELELWAFVKTADWGAFTVVRQDVILKIAEIVEAAGTRLAAPTQLTYLSRDAAFDTEKANDIVRQVTELRASDAFRFPGEARTGKE